MFYTLGMNDNEREIPRMPQNQWTTGISGSSNQKLKKSKVKNSSKKCSLCRTFLQNSSLYALNRIAESGTPTRKLFWILILLIGIIGFVSQVGEFLVSYYTYPIMENVESIHATKQQFPAVTICNLNRMKVKYLGCFLARSSYYDCINSINSGIGTHPRHLQYINKAFNDDPSNEIVFSQVYQYRREYGHQIDDFVKQCLINDDWCFASDFNISVSNFFQGNCYTLQQKEEKFNTWKQGPKSGLTVVLDVEEKEYLPSTASVGVRVQIHDPDVECDVDSYGITASAGFETSIMLSKIMYERLPPPYRDRCKYYELGDSRKRCVENCQDNAIISECGCSRNAREGIPMCTISNASMIQCLFDMIKGTKCECPVPCRETQYDMQVSTALWPSKAYFEENALDQFAPRYGSTENVTYESIRNTRLKLKIYFNTLDYTLYKQSEKYLSSDIFTQIGGQAGLWLGFSLMFFFEAVEMFCVRKTAVQKRKKIGYRGAVP